ncbi:BTB/POZ domain-containing protein At3g22104 isoform X1 [Morus notabilis]|uniref:BTB/POZ domain-containing protein At3g22104 isoform X1 n=1 Tax=Morus notabilis TaxID=981085 RepID=UPI000CED4915|nr:BTB/POZ domain-containing protein At3g22104 isoform X1 [Morus notabilis]
MIIFFFFGFPHFLFIIFFSGVMEFFCDLEVDVNGEETFMVDRKILASYSGRLSKLFGKSKGSAPSLKVVFHDFPGGAECFELMLRFCYNFGRTAITPSNISLLHCAAKFMEMKSSVSKASNLLEQTEKSFEETRYWTWAELLMALKQCQGLLPASDSSGILDKCFDSLVGRLALASEVSPCPSTSSPDSSGFRFSCDTKSTESLKTVFSKTTWWFEDLLFLSLVLVEMLVKSMVSRKFNHVIISRFLVYYQKSKSSTASFSEKCRIVETVVDMLYILDQSCVSCKSLFEIHWVALNLKLRKNSRNKLENMIGSQLDHATLDNLLAPSPYGMNYLYDVNLVLRFLKVFLRGLCQVSAMRLNKVASLLDLYIAEVAPDPYLKPSKFLALIMALPESARDSYDEIYHAVDMYLEVHSGLSEEEKMKICCSLNLEKLSAEACIHLSQNTKFPSKSAVQALISQQFKLKSLLHATTKPPKSFADSPSTAMEAGNESKKHESEDQIVLYAGKLDLQSDSKDLRAHLQGMQWRVMELEKVCRKMQIQMAKIMKSRAPSHSHSRSLPRLCS